MSDQATQAMARIVTHEAVCSERYRSIVERIGRIENLVMTAIGGIILQLLGAVGFLFHRVLG